MGTVIFRGFTPDSCPPGGWAALRPLWCWDWGNFRPAHPQTPLSGQALLRPGVSRTPLLWALGRATP